MLGQRMYVIWKVGEQNNVKVQIKFNIVYFWCYSVEFMLIAGLICKLYLQVNVFTFVSEQ